MRDSLDILIVNWNSGQHLRQCLDSLRLARRQSFVLSRVVVVDNASTDGSADSLPADGLPLEVIRNTSNRGFAAAINQAAQGSTADLLLLLNPDTLLQENSLDVPAAFLHSSTNAQVAIAGIQLVGDDGLPQRCCERFMTPMTMVARALGLHRLPVGLDCRMSEWDHRDTREVDHVIGAFYMVRRSVFDLLGGLDERFFVYFEDHDFSMRSAASGWKTIYLSSAQAYHKGGGSSGNVKATRLAYSLHSRLLFARKQFGIAGYATVAVATLFLEPLVRGVAALSHSSLEELGEVAGGYAMLWRRLAVPHTVQQSTA